MTVSKTRKSLTRLRVDGRLFLDELRCQVTLRGVNLGGDSKVPYPQGGTQWPTDFSDHRVVSFVGRPFPLDEANGHFSRIAHWGFNCVRLVVTWEAVAHAGPGQFDLAYLDYLQAICDKAGQHGLYVFIDFHQDVWSRMSGGDGAPGWTFEAVGLDFRKFEAAGASHVMQQKFDYANPNPHQPNYPAMSWANNYRMPVNGIMWTLFWAGRAVTPDFLIEGENVQNFLQSHFLAAMNAVALRLKDMPHVVGFGTLNEPGVGWLGQTMSPTTDAAALPASQALMPGPHWSPLQSLAVAAGNPTWLNTWTRDAETGQLVCGAPQLVNPNGIRLWRDGRTCPFEAAGTYRRVGAQVTVLNESVFCEKAAGVPWNISEHAYAPFFERVAQTVRAHQPAWLLFAELDPFGAFAGRAFPSDMPAGSINASHWYDIGLLLSKSFDVTSSLDPVTGLAARGPAEIRARYVQQLARLQSLGDHFTATGAPMLVGEFGIPYDLNASAAYRAWANGARGDACWAVHGMALRLMYDAIDHLQLNSTQWNYSAGNRNDPRTGDQWNQEDLSIYSLDQHDEPNDPDSGGRAVAGFCRPYAPVIQGRLTRVHWDADNALFSLDYEADAALVAPSLVYLPQRQFVKGTQLFLAGAAVRWDWLSDQVLCVWALASGSVHLEATHA